MDVRQRNEDVCILEQRKTDTMRRKTLGGLGGKGKRKWVWINISLQNGEYHRHKNEEARGY